MSLFFEDVLALLRDGGVQYVIVGGTAVIVHGVPRTTADLDLVVDLDPANLRRLVAAMIRLGYRPRVPVDPHELCDPARRREWVEDKGMRAFIFQWPGHPLADIDVLIDSPLDYAELSRHAERLDAGGLHLRIASVDDLIRMKTAAAREQDLDDVDALRRLQEATQGG
ncbi:MAG TPA: nucleotidyl transferase AbiEii/AbiGii toxin family protein [Kofleriaceae bacterium]|nr:nucleotidyl transferase AbiEii/AbiGii toxin family protein [Kofleriaceae bacterium]